MRPTLTLARSLRSSHLCGLDQRGRGNYSTEGITKLCEGLRGSAVTSLECAAAPSRPLSRRPLLAPTPTLALARSLFGNQLCGLSWHFGGTYTTEGITKLCEGLRGSNITSLECAAAP